MAIDNQNEQDDRIEQIVDDVELESVAGGDGSNGKGTNTGVEG